MKSSDINQNRRTAQSIYHGVNAGGYPGGDPDAPGYIPDNPATEIIYGSNRTPRVIVPETGNYLLEVHALFTSGADAGTHTFSVRKTLASTVAVKKQYIATKNANNSGQLFLQLWPSAVALNEGDIMSVYYSLYGAQNDSSVLYCSLKLIKVLIEE
jgi:hypothetical protein